MSHPPVMMTGVKLSEWARASGVSRQSATRWFHAGVLPVPARQLATGTSLVEEPERQSDGVAIDAQVSSADQRGALDRQVARLVTHLTTSGLVPTSVVSEVGSGLNGHRLTSFCARLCGRRSAKRRAELALAAAGKAAA